MNDVPFSEMLSQVNTFRFILKVFYIVGTFSSLTYITEHIFESRCYPIKIIVLYFISKRPTLSSTEADDAMRTETDPIIDRDRLYHRPRPTLSSTETDPLIDRGRRRQEDRGR
jgi:hypothetical protein